MLLLNERPLSLNLCIAMALTALFGLWHAHSQFVVIYLATLGLSALFGFAENVGIRFLPIYSWKFAAIVYTSYFMNALLLVMSIGWAVYGMYMSGMLNQLSPHA